MIDENDYETLTYYADGRNLDTLWDAWQHSEKQTFIQRRDIFLWILERLLKEGRIKLHKNGVFLEGSIEEQIAQFREKFPKAEKDADRICTKPGYEVPYEGFGMNLWWFMDICPAGVAWRKGDGQYIIVD